MWSDYSTESSSERSSVGGIAFLAGACSSNRYAISEDRGLENIQVKKNHKISQIVNIIVTNN